MAASISRRWSFAQPSLSRTPLNSKLGIDSYDIAPSIVSQVYYYPKLDHNEAENRIAAHT